MKNLAYFIIVMLCAALVGLLQAHVATDLWRWFVVPLGVMAINIWHAWGLLFLWSCVKGPGRNAQPVEDGKGWERAYTMLLGSVLVSLIAWGGGAIFRGLI